MALSTSIPPWLDVTPQSFLGALESGSRVGLQLGAMRQRSDEAQAEREAAATRQAAQQSFEQAKLAQTTAYETAKEQRLGQYDLAKAAIDKAREEIAARKEQAADEFTRKRLDMQDKGLQFQRSKMDIEKTLHEDRLNAQIAHWTAMEDRLTNKPRQPGSLTATERQRIKDIDKEATTLATALPPNPPVKGFFTSQAKVDDYTKRAGRLEALKAEKERILTQADNPDNAPAGGAKRLTVDAAQQFLQQAGGDKAKARQLARDAGYTF